MMNIQRIAAFAKGNAGGNPAGVVLLDAPLAEAEMAQIAAEVGYSETAFAVAPKAADQPWRVRYFSPESEVPFCGHATIALGAVLGDHAGAGRYALQLNDAEIAVETRQDAAGTTASLTSPPTRSRALTDAEWQQALALFGLQESDLDPRLAPAHIHGGADHILLPLRDRQQLADMHYDLDQGRQMMTAQGLVTIMLVHIRNDRTFDVRNAFASGGVLEDPATGAAAAAFAGYLRDQNWPHGGAFTIHQGEDMGAPSQIEVRLGDAPGTPVEVSGRARRITGA